MAMEFLTLYTPSEHNQGLDDLRKLMTPYYLDIMSTKNKTFWHRRVGPCHCTNYVTQLLFY